MGPACQFSLPPRAGPPWLRRHRIPPRPASPRHPAPRLEWLPLCLYLLHHQGPSLTPLNLAPSSMVLKPLTPSLPSQPPLIGAPSTPIKGNESPRPSPSLFPSLPRSFALTTSSSHRCSLPLSCHLFAAARAPVSTPLAPPRPTHPPPPSPVSTSEP
jgi:hypothetical protein